MTDSILPGTLVSPEWLAERLTDPGLQVVDIRGYVKTEDLGEGRQHAEYVGARDEYDREHIPGSVFVDWTTDIVDPDHEVKAQLAPADRFAEAMSRRGIGDETDVVVVDHTGGHFATRLWWALKYYGHDRVAVLDGGFNRWKALGLAADGRRARDAATRIHPSGTTVAPRRGGRASGEDRRAVKRHRRCAGPGAVHGGDPAGCSGRSCADRRQHLGEVARQRRRHLEVGRGAARDPRGGWRAG